MKKAFPVKLALIYLLAGGLWILFSDRLPLPLQPYKGWVSVIAAAIVLYAFTHRFLRRLQESVEALQKSEKQFHGIIETAQEGIVVIDTGGKVRYTNKQMADMLQYRVEELLNRRLIDFVDTADHTQIELCFAKCRQGIREKHDFRLLRKDSSLLWVLVSTNPLFDERNTFIGGLGMFMDITERKLAEERLYKTNELLRALIHASPLALFTLDRTGNVTLWNPAAERLFGWTEQEVLGKPNPIVPEEKREDFLALRKEVIKGKVFTGLELTRKRKDGQRIEVSLSTAPLYNAPGELQGSIVLVSDITERKLAEASLRESEERHRIVSETAQDAIIIIDEESTMTFLNPAAQRIFGYTIDELQGKPLTMLMPERMRNAHLTAIRRYIATGRRQTPWQAVGLPGLHKNGKEIPLEISYGEFIKDDKYFFIGIIRDITERKQAEDALRASEQKYRALFEESKDTIYFSTPDGRFIDINPAGVEMFGYASKEEILNVNIPADLYAHPEDREKFKEIIARRGFVKDYDILMKKKDGERIVVLLTGAAVRDEQGAIIAYRGFMRDVTNQRTLEQQLLQSQKMEAIGQLAGGVAHDFNNIVTAVISYSSLLQMSMPEDDPSRTYVDQILALADRAASLTQSLLAFSRKQIMNPKEINVNDIIQKVEKLLVRIIGEDIELRDKLSGEDLIVMADSSQIEQALINLATNSRDAMPGGGLLTISTRRVRLDREFSRTHGFGAPGDYALITVSDTGIGMDENTRMRLFEPFFTTKEMGKGTGLGLSIVYGIVKQHNGFINVYSEPGKGSSFKIYLPLVKAPGGEPELAAEGIKLPTGKETILVAEDEPDLRKTTKIVLEKFGYTVIDAVDGEEALRKFEENKDTIDLLLLDVVMPRKNGKEVYDAIRRIRPDIKALFTSGYTAEIVHKKGLLQEDIQFLTKPFTVEALLKKLREVLQ